MENIKLKKVYLPFLLLSFLILVGYNAFRWIFDIQFGLLPYHNDLLNIWAPALLVFATIYFGMRDRLKFLDTTKYRADGHFMLILILSFLVFLPLMMSQFYLTNAAYHLIEIQDIDEVKKYKHQKYFQCKYFSVRQNRLGKHGVHKVTSKGSGLNFNLYLVAQFHESETTFYGISYRKSLSNRTTEAEKTTQYKTFLEKSLMDFHQRNFQDISYFELLKPSEKWDNFQKAVHDEFNHDSFNHPPFILIPHHTKFSSRADSNRNFFLGFLGFGILFSYLLIMLFPINKK